MNEGQIEQVGTPEQVYDHPATPFVYNFLGNVNLFHSRVVNGKAHIGSLEMVVPGNSHPDGQAVMYVRPHLLDIEQQPTGADHFRARVKHINRTGPLVKIELITEWGDIVNVEMPQERFINLGLRSDLEVFVKPREVRVFIANP